MDLDTVRLGWSSGLLDLDGFSFGSGLLVFVGLDLDGFFWIWTFGFLLDLDLVGFFSRFGFGRFFFQYWILVFFGSGSFGLLLDWIGLVFRQKWICRFSVGIGSQTVFSKSA